MANPRPEHVTGKIYQHAGDRGGVSSMLGSMLDAKKTAGSG